MLFNSRVCNRRGYVWVEKAWENTLKLCTKLSINTIHSTGTPLKVHTQAPWLMEITDRNCTWNKQTWESIIIMGEKKWMWTASVKCRGPSTASNQARHEKVKQIFHTYKVQGRALETDLMDKASKRSKRADEALIWTKGINEWNGSI